MFPPLVSQGLTVSKTKYSFILHPIPLCLQTNKQMQHLSYYGAYPTTTHLVQGNVNVLQVFWAFVKPRLGQQSAVLHASLMFFGSLAAELTCKSKNSKKYKLLDVLLLSINLNIKTADNLTF